MSKCNQIKPKFCKSKYGEYCEIIKTGESVGRCGKKNGGPVLENVIGKHTIGYSKHVAQPLIEANVDTAVEDINSVQFHFPEVEDITEGSETASILDFHREQFVEISPLITEEQFNYILHTEYIQTYIKLRENLNKQTISFLIIIINILYGQIEAIKSASLSKSETAKQINELIIASDLCKFIDGEKEQLLQYASNLGLPVKSNTNKSVLCYLLLGTILADISYTITKMIEKQYFNLDKRGLPTELSDLTPPQIADIINQNVLKLNGPIYGVLLVPKPEFTQILGRNPPVFMLLGDEHFGNQQCADCHMGTCYSLYKDDPTFYKFLSILAKAHNISIDLFLENWTAPEEREKNVFRRKSNIRENSALIESSHLMIPCIGQRKENKLRQSCFFTEFRTHNADPRKTYYNHSDKYTGDTILVFLNYFTQKKSAAINLHNAYPGFNVYQELLSLYSAKNNLQTIILYFNSPFFKKYSRTLHEFYQLPDVIQGGLMEGLLNAARNDIEEAYMMSRDSSIRSEMVTALTNFIGDNSESNENKLQLVMEKAVEIFGISFGASLVDIYTLSRALKGFTGRLPDGQPGGLPSQLSVVYQGMYHIQREISLLGKYYDVVQTWNSPTAESDKCIYRQ
jgi:hypothetical protein